MKNDHSFILSSPMVHQVYLVISFWRQASEYLTAQDLYVGAPLCLNSVRFQLLDADEYTFEYMEQHAEEVGRKLTEEYLFCVVYVRFRIKCCGFWS